MRMELLRWILLGVGLVHCEGFVVRSALRVPCARKARRKQGFQRESLCTMQTDASARGTVAPVTPGVDIEEISGKRLYVEFEALGFFERVCQIELKKNGDCTFSKGMVTASPGAWRVEEEDGSEYLQFSSPLTELYSDLFDVPSSLFFWRISLKRGEDGNIVMEDGQIISEKKELFGLRSAFVTEGTFKARILADDEPFPVGTDLDLSDIKVPEELAPRKKKSKQNVSFEQIIEPPLISELSRREK